MYLLRIRWLTWRRANSSDGQTWIITAKPDIHDPVLRTGEAMLDAGFEPDICDFLVGQDMWDR